MMTTHWVYRQLLADIFHEAVVCDPTKVLPHERVREFCFDLSCASVDADERFVDDQHVEGIVARPAATCSIGVGQEFGNFERCRIVQNGFDAFEGADWPGAHRASGCVRQFQPMSERGTVKGPHSQPPCDFLDAAGLLKDLAAGPRGDGKGSQVRFAIESGACECIADCHR